jgi:hypothetical protein
LEGAAAPSASTTHSAKSDRASDGNAVRGSLLRRTTSAPCPGHRRQGLLQESGPSRQLGRSPRSLSQLSPEDISPARGLGNSVPASVPPVDGPARLRPTKSSFQANSASVHAGTAASGFGSSKSGRGFPLTKQEKPRAARPTEPRDSYASGIWIPHSSPSHEATHTWLSGSASRQASPSARNEDETRLHAKIHTCSGPDSHDEQTPALKVPLQMELRFRPYRYEQPPTLEGLRGDETLVGSPTPAPAAATTTSAPGGQTAAAMASGRTLLQRAPRPRPHSRGEDKLSKPKSRRPGAWMVAVIPSATRTSSAATTSTPTTEAICPPADPHSDPPGRASIDPHAEASYRSKGRTT